MSSEWLIVFDDAAAVHRSLWTVTDASRVTLLPLTADPGVSAVLRSKFEKLGAHVELLDGATLIEREAHVLKDGLAGWSARVGRSRAGSLTVRERFFRAELGLSAWWFGFLAEKNPLKTDAFLCIAQLRAVRAELARHPGARLAAAVSSPELTQALAVLAGERPAVRELFSPPLRAAALWARAASRGLLAGLVLGSRARRLPPAGATLFAGYFPAYDKTAAATGQFRSRYAAALQEVLAERGRAEAWLLTYVPLEGRSWFAALGVLREFIRAGERLFLIEEFFGLSEAVSALSLWLSVSLEAGAVWREVDREALFSEPMSPEAEPILRALWARSFFGAPLMEGIVATMAYRRAFAEFPRPSACVYWSEMLGWEKALSSVARDAGVKTIGFQHGSILGSFFNYFPDPSETSESSPDSLPLPDVYAADGEIPREILSRSIYPGLCRVEALRYLGLHGTLAAPPPPPPVEPVLLVAGSIDAAETRSLAILALRAFPDGKVRLLFKGHPGQAFGPFLRELGLPGRPGVDVFEGSLAQAIARASAVLAGSSGAGLEALAAGRETIVPRWPDALPMSPLSDFPEFRRDAGGPEDLRREFFECAAGKRRFSVEDGRGFLRRYWDLNESLPAWRGLLGLG